MKIVFYDYGGLKNFTITSNDFQQNYELREWQQVELPFTTTDNLIISHDGEEINYAEYVKNIGENILKITH